MGGGWLETPQERVEGAATGGHRRGWGAHLSRRLERGSPGDRVRGGGGGQAGGQRDRGQAGRQVGAAERRARAAAAEVVGGGDRETADGRPDDGTWDPEPLQRSPARPPGGQQRPSAWAPCRQHRALVQPVSQSRPDRSRFQKASGAGGGHVGGVRPPPSTGRSTCAWGRGRGAVGRHRGLRELEAGRATQHAPRPLRPHSRSAGQPGGLQRAGQWGPLVARAAPDFSSSRISVPISRRPKEARLVQGGVEAPRPSFARADPDLGQCRLTRPHPQALRPLGTARRSGCHAQAPPAHPPGPPPAVASIGASPAHRRGPGGPGHLRSPSRPVSTCPSASLGPPLPPERGLGPSVMAAASVLEPGTLGSPRRCWGAGGP